MIHRRKLCYFSIEVLIISFVLLAFILGYINLNLKCQLRKAELSIIENLACINQEVDQNFSKYHLCSDEVKEKVKEIVRFNSRIAVTEAKIIYLEDYVKDNSLSEWSSEFKRKYDSLQTELLLLAAYRDVLRYNLAIFCYKRGVVI